MAKKMIIGALCLALLPASAFSDEGINCEKKFSELNDRYSTQYIDLDSQCYPEGEVLGCGFELSPDCQAKYDALAQQSTNEFNALAEQCPDFFLPNEITDTAAPEGVQRSPSKKKLLGQIQGLKKKLKAERKKNRNLRARAECR